MNEDQIRDILAPNIETLEIGLTLVDKEVYIPNELGTRGFIDLLAIDRKGRWVLIELKRTQPATREAIHEIIKYVEGVKKHLAVNDNEVRVIIASTEWKELIVPFSRFVHDTSMTVKGLLLAIDGIAGIVAEEIEVLPFRAGRMLSNQHEISLYQSSENLAKGRKSFEQSCKAKGIQNFILVELEANEEFSEHASRFEATAIARARGMELTEQNLAAIAIEHPYNGLMLYFVPETLSPEHYLEIIKSDADTYEEVREVLEDMNQDETNGCLEEYAMDTLPRPYRDYFEIGYAAKFKNKLLEDEGWKIINVHRYGAFERNSALTNDTIISEICGEDGSTHQRLHLKIALNDKSEFENAKSSVGNCLKFNPTWKSQILSILDEELALSSNGIANIRIFAPSTGLLTLFFSTSRDDGLQFIPSFSVAISEEGKDIRGYLGDLAPISDDDVEPEKYSKLLNEFYDGDVGSLLLSTTWGGYETRDAEVLEFLNLEYSTVRIEVSDGGDRTYGRRRDGRWVAIDPFAELAGKFREYIIQNKKFIQTINRKLGPRYGATVTIADNATMRLKAEESAATIAQQKYYDIGSECCDLCHLPLCNETYIADAQIRRELTAGQMAWAHFCADCALFHSMGFGWGVGQLYRNVEKGRFLMVAGADEGETDSEAATE